MCALLACGGGWISAFLSAKPTTLSAVTRLSHDAWLHTAAALLHTAVGSAAAQAVLDTDGP